MRWWLRSIPGVPVNSFGFHRAHPDAYPANSAFGFIDGRPLAYPILDEISCSTAGAGHGRSADYFEARVEEGLYVFADYFNVLTVICAQACLLARSGCGHDLRVEVYDSACSGIYGNGVAGKEQNAHFLGLPASGAVALHSYDTVHHTEAWFDQSIQINEHGSEIVGVRQLDMVLAFQEAGYAAKLVLHSSGESDQRVRFKLGQVNQAIGVQDAVGNNEALD